MAGFGGAATRRSRAQAEGAAGVPRRVDHAALANGGRSAGTDRAVAVGHEPRHRREFGRSHDLQARHAVVWNRDPRAAVRIGNALRRRAHTVHVVAGAAALDRCLRHDEPDIVVVDLDDIATVSAEVFGEDGPPLIGLTAASDPLVRTRYLDLGAADVVPAPLSIPELDARMRAVLARTTETARPVLDTQTCGTLRLDPATSRVRVRDTWIDLTALELKLLSFLMQHPAQAFSRDQLLKHVWGFTLGDTSTVSVHIRRLRLKLEAEPARPVIIRTVWGVGYYLEPPT